MAKAWEKEAAVIKLERGGSGLGFNIRGGVDQPHLPNDTGIFVTKIRENCAADIDGRLKEGDKLIEINGKSLIEVKHSEAVDYFLTAGEHVTLKVWHGAEKALVEPEPEIIAKPVSSVSQEEYTEMNKPKPWSPFTKLILVVGVAAAIGLTVYYFKRS